MFKTDEVTASYAFVFEPHEELNNTMAYSITMLIPKSDTEGIAKVKTEIIRVCKEKWEAKAKAKFKDPDFWNPLRDGDLVDGGRHPGFMFMRAKTDRQPKIIDKFLDSKGGVRILTDSEDFYSGCICKCALSFYAFDKPTGAGVGLGLQSILKIDDGERIDGKSSNPEVDFEDDLKAAPTVKEDDAFDTDTPAAEGKAAATPGKKADPDNFDDWN